MRVSRELDYGIRATVVLAAHEGEVLSKRTIAEGFHIPINFLAIILPKLVHHGLAESLPGPHGGYRLARPAGRITLYDILTAMGRELTINNCLDEAIGCAEQERCPVSPHWARLKEQIEAFLRGVRLDELARDFKAG